MPPLYKCTHRNQTTGQVLSCFHEGQRCTEDVFNEEASCFLFQRSWVWLGCEPVPGTLVMDERGAITVINSRRIGSERKEGSNGWPRR